MNVYRVAIPSHKRAELISELTLPVLIRGGVPPHLITVYVNEPAEAREYQAAMEAAGYGSISVVWHGQGPGLWRSRNAITRDTRPGTWVIQVDDDIKKIARKLDDIYLDVKPDVDRLIRDGCRLADAHGVRLWGVYPIDNPLFMNLRVRLGLLYIEGAFWGMKPRGDAADLVESDDKEDFMRSALCWEADGGVLRIENIGIDSDYYKVPGGMVEYRTDEGNERAADAIHARWPEETRRFTSKGRGKAEVAFRNLKRLSRVLDVPLPLGEDRPVEVVKG